MSGLARLREVAEAATPGPWQWWQGDILATEDRGKLFILAALRNGNAGATVRFRRDHVMDAEPDGHPDAEHIATFDPSTVLALLDVAETADGLLTHYHDDFQGAFTSMQAALDRLSEVAS